MKGISISHIQDYSIRHWIACCVALEFNDFIAHFTRDFFAILQFTNNLAIYIAFHFHRKANHNFFSLNDKLSHTVHLIIFSFV